MDWHRVAYGWGRIAEEEWPYFDERQPYGSPEPPGADQLAKRYRIPRYQRVRGSEDCRKILDYDLRIAKKHGRKIIDGSVPYFYIKCGLEITQQFVDSPRGIVLEPDPGTPIVGTHSVSITEDLKGQRKLGFLNSWGESWGDAGFGTLPYEFLDRWMVEGYASEEPLTTSPPVRAAERAWDAVDPLGGRFFGFEVGDVKLDERIGWAFAVCRDEYLDLEELYVRPDYRRRGHGGNLVRRVLDLARDLGRPLRAWVPFADCDPRNREALVATLKVLGVSASPSGNRWAAYVALPGAGSNGALATVRIPQRPAYARDGAGRVPSPKASDRTSPGILLALNPGRGVVPADLLPSRIGGDSPPPIDSEAWGRMNRRRAELIDKKVREGIEGLSEEEREEYAELQRLSRDALRRAFPGPQSVREELERLKEALGVGPEPREA